MRPQRAQGDARCCGTRREEVLRVRVAAPAHERPAASSFPLVLAEALSFLAFEFFLLFAFFGSFRVVDFFDHAGVLAGLALARASFAGWYGAFLWGFLLELAAGQCARPAGRGIARAEPWPRRDISRRSLAFGDGLDYPRGR